MKVFQIWLKILSVQLEKKVLKKFEQDNISKSLTKLCKCLAAEENNCYSRRRDGSAVPLKSCGCIEIERLWMWEERELLKGSNCPDSN